jgi:hypothetical protein
MEMFSDPLGRRSLIQLVDAKHLYISSVTSVGKEFGEGIESPTDSVSCVSFENDSYKLSLLKWTKVSTTLRIEFLGTKEKFMTEIAASCNQNIVTDSSGSTRDRNKRFNFLIQFYSSFEGF